ALPEQSAEPHKALMEWARETRAARLKADHRAWLDAGLHTLALAPDHPDLLISVARARAALGEAKESLELLRQAIDRGAGIDIPRVQEFQKLAPSPELDGLVARARRNLEPVPRAKLFGLLPDPTDSSEGIAFDPISKHLFVGTNHGEILRVDERGSASTLVPRGSGLLEVLGLKVDAERRLIWAATATFPDLFSAEPKPDTGVSGVYAFRLDNGKLAHRYSLDERPVLHGFNDLALARNGDVYVTDCAQAAVYKVHAGKLELLVRDEHLTFANGIALAPDQKRLYVAHVEGITLIDLPTRKVQRLRWPAKFSMERLGGLVEEGGDPSGVQSSASVARVVRIFLGDGGGSVKGVSTMNSRCPAEYNQTTAAVGGDQLYVVAGAPAVDSAASPLAKEPKPQIVSMPLR